MGDTKKKAKTLLDPSSGGTNIGGLIDPGGTIIERATGSSAARKIADPLGLVPDDPGPQIEAAEEEARKAQEDIERQKQREKVRQAEEEDVIGRKRLRGRRGGRSLLVATSPTGQARTSSLGGL